MRESRSDRVTYFEELKVQASTFLTHFEEHIYRRAH